jgi:hypothetical protein
VEETGKVIVSASPNKNERAHILPLYDSVQSVHPTDQADVRLLELERSWQERLRHESSDAFESGRQAGRKDMEEEIKSEAQKHVSSIAKSEQAWQLKLAQERQDYFERGKAAARKQLKEEQQKSATVSAAVAVAKAAADFDQASRAVEKKSAAVEEARASLQAQIAEAVDEGVGKEGKKAKRSKIAKLEQSLRHAELEQASMAALVGHARKVMGECTQQMLDVALRMGSSAEGSADSSAVSSAAVSSTAVSSAAVSSAAVSSTSVCGAESSAGNSAGSSVDSGMASGIGGGVPPPQRTDSNAESVPKRAATQVCKA